MAFKFPDKDPDERLDYTVDWSRFLSTGESIDTSTSGTNTSVWKIQKADGSFVEFAPDKSFEGDAVVNNTGSTTGLTLLSSSFTGNGGTRATIVLSKGIANTSYRLLCQIRITNGSDAEADRLVTNREINLRVRERS
tara:strand:- start:635 stop:1045 length:411 start_codon:yes stop_codon:yes gene_type:complete